MAFVILLWYLGECAKVTTKNLPRRIQAFIRRVQSFKDTDFVSSSYSSRHGTCLQSTYRIFKKIDEISFSFDAFLRQKQSLLPFNDPRRRVGSQQRREGQGGEFIFYPAHTARVPLSLSLLRYNMRSATHVQRVFV